MIRKTNYIYKYILKRRLFFRLQVETKKKQQQQQIHYSLCVLSINQ